MTVLIFAAISAIAIGLCFVILIVLPKDLTSLYRYKFWLIRDAVYDDISTGAYEDVAEARRFVEMVENTIVVLDKMTLLTFLVLRSGSAPGRPRTFDLSRMPPADQGRIKPYYYHWGGLVTRRMFLASWSGLAACALLLPPFVAIQSVASWSRRDGSILKLARDQVRALSGQMRDWFQAELPDTAPSRSRLSTMI